MNSSVSPGNRGIILSLALSQALNSACVPISVIVASLTVVDLSGGDGRWAGVPTALGMAGGALASFMAGRVLPTVGYRKVLLFAAGSGMTGAALAGFSAWKGLFHLFMAAFLVYGMAIGLFMMSRYAAAEASEPAARARSMGKVVLGATVGAILGPLLVAPFGRLAESLGLPSLTGPWLAVFLCYGLGALNTFFLLRPEPKEVASLRAAAVPAPAGSAVPARGLGALLKERTVVLAIGSLVAAQGAMVLVMAITPLHMHSHHHPMGTISTVITAHFMGMYGLSVLSGWLADKLGRMRTVGLGGAVLALSCILAPLAHGMPLLMAALFLLGLGWSFCFLGASSSLSEGLAEGERGKVQGFSEALVSISSGAASLGSGLLFAAFGFGTMTLVGLGVSVLPLLFFLASPAPVRPRAIPA